VNWREQGNWEASDDPGKNYTDSTSQNYWRQPENHRPFGKHLAQGMGGHLSLKKYSLSEVTTLGVSWNSHGRNSRKDHSKVYLGPYHLANHNICLGDTYETSCQTNTVAGKPFFMNQHRESHLKDITKQIPLNQSIYLFSKDPVTWLSATWI
jgi:hypothetical protein